MSKTRTWCVSIQILAYLHEEWPGWNERTSIFKPCISSTRTCYHICHIAPTHGSPDQKAPSKSALLWCRDTAPWISPWGVARLGRTDCHFQALNQLYDDVLSYLPYCPNLWIARSESTSKNPPPGARPHKSLNISMRSRPIRTNKTPKESPRMRSTSAYRHDAMASQIHGSPFQYATQKLQVSHPPTQILEYLHGYSPDSDEWNTKRKSSIVSTRWYIPNLHTIPTRHSPLQYPPQKFYPSHAICLFDIDFPSPTVSAPTAFLPLRHIYMSKTITNTSKSRISGTPVGSRIVSNILLSGTDSRIWIILGNLSPVSRLAALSKNFTAEIPQNPALNVKSTLSQSFLLRTNFFGIFAFRFLLDVSDFPLICPCFLCRFLIFFGYFSVIFNLFSGFQ